MAKPILPPYLGTWDELVQALLNNPSLGGGGVRFPVTHLDSLTQTTGPTTEPASPATALFVVAAALKDVVARLPEGQKSQLSGAISQAADDWDGWYCGNGPRPRPHVIQTAGELMAFAGTLEAGSLRTRIVRQAAALLERSFNAPAENETTRVTAIAS